MSESDKFNYTVKQLRIQLNKLSKDNFDVIAKSIIQDQQFSPSLLNELMKIIFMKATVEHNYLEIYVKLCVLLFKKYKDKDNKEMDFKKLLIKKCEKQFYKMMERKEEERRSRKASQITEEDLKNNGGVAVSEFNKQMLFIYDKSEIEYRRK
jgi:hypothetical protein